jgi:hypothetical protein
MPKIKTVEEVTRADVGTMFEQFTRTASQESPTPKTDPVVDEDPIDEPDEQENNFEHESPDDGEASSEHIEEEEEETPPSSSDVEEQLRRRIAELETSQPLKPVERQAKQETPEQDVPIEIEDFITDAEMAEIQSDPKKMNEILLRVYKRARVDASSDVLQRIPEIIQASTSRQVTLQESVRRFYEENADLRNHAQYVGFVANQIRSKNPEMPLDQLFKETEQVVRKNLTITKTAKEKEESRQNNGKNKNDQPAFARRGSGSRTGGKQDVRSDFQKQADAMIKTLNI